jgi:glycosyltransferase involved in cell wall biosynthesis
MSAELPFTRGLVIVPAYNEADAIARVVEEVKAAAPNFDVVVIDDGSTDATPRQVPPTARVIRLPFNLGIGGAMQTGYRYAARHGYDLAVQVDGDGQHRADQLPALIEPLVEGRADLVIGSRFMQPSGYRQGPARTLGRLVLGLVLRLLTGERFTDCTSGFRAANRRVIEAFAHWYPDDYPEPEVVLLLQRAGFRVAETPVVMSQRLGGRTSIPLLRGFYYVIKVSAALLLDTIRTPWPRREVLSA